MGKLLNKLAHACGLYTADDVEEIEKHWRDRLDRAQSVPVRLEMGAGGSGGHGYGHTLRERSYWECWNTPRGMTISPSEKNQTLIWKLDNPPAPSGQPPLHKGALRMSGAERRQLPGDAVRWCEQQRIEQSPENIIFYLDDRRMISAPTPETAEKEEKTKPAKCRQCINYGWGMPQCRECNPGNNWKYFQKDL